METFWRDLNYGIRMLGKKPGFTAIAVFTLALGIGANTTIFSILNAVLLRPLPFPQSERLLTVWGTDSRNAEFHRTLSYPDFADYRNQNHTLEALAAYDEGTFSLTGRGEPQQLHGVIVSANLLSVLGRIPQLGGGFSPVDLSHPRIEITGGGVDQGFAVHLEFEPDLGVGQGVGSHHCQDMAFLS